MNDRLRAFTVYGSLVGSLKILSINPAGTAKGHGRIALLS